MVEGWYNGGCIGKLLGNMIGPYPRFGNWGMFGFPAKFPNASNMVFEGQWFYLLAYWGQSPKVPIGWLGQSIGSADTGYCSGATVIWRESIAYKVHTNAMGFVLHKTSIVHNSRRLKSRNDNKCINRNKTIYSQPPKLKRLRQ